MNLPSNLFLLMSSSSLGIKKLKYILQWLISLESGMCKVRDFKFGVRTDRQAYNQKMQKPVKRGVAYVTWHTFTILGPLYISGMRKATDFKFSAGIDLRACKPKNTKLGQVGAWLKLRDLLLNFPSPFISVEWVKLKTSN